ncbi:MAG: Trm112 family protein [Desulfovibrio sp.]|nr:Trm112 family protein [Desulfovibrio sp.]
MELKAILSYLACPSCHGDLSIEGEDHPSALLCANCHLRYPIQDGIPLLLASEAQAIDTQPKE